MGEELTPDTVFSRSGGLLRGMRSLLCVCSTRLPGCPDGSAPALRGESGPTLGLNCAAGKCVDRHSYRHEISVIKSTRFQAAPAASIAGHVGRRVDRIQQFLRSNRIKLIFMFYLLEKV